MPFSIADLAPIDDLNVPVNPDEYVDQASPAPVKPGNYRLVVTKHSIRTDKSGNLVLQDNKFPTIIIEQVKIVEPVEDERLVSVFADIRTKPFTRKGQGGREVPASDLYDLLRAYDATVVIENFDHAKQLLQQYFEQGASFIGQLGLQGYDKTYVEQQFAALGVPRDSVAKDVVNGIYSKARLGTKNFVIDGKLQSSVQGPSGEMIDARPRLGQKFATTSKDYEKAVNNLGPFKK